MEIILKHLELCNFGMFRTYEMDFDPKVTCIHGRNGSGKSTIANAIQWLFSGKSADGRSQFSIKTHDKDGNEIPKVDHYVRAVCLINGEETELKKGISEKWTKVKGENREVMSNQTYYFLNGTPLTQKDWDEQMESYVNAQVFKAVTNPTYFVSLDWKTQRDFLSRIVGGVRQEEVVGDNHTFDPLLKLLAKQTIDNIIKQTGYKIKELQKKLDLIPVRLAEQDKALPDKQDWDKAKQQLTEKQDELKTLQDELTALHNNPSDTLRNELNKKLADINQKIFVVKEGAKSAYEHSRISINAEINAISRQITQTENTIADLTAKVDGIEKLIKRAGQAKAAAKMEKQNIETEFEKLRNTHLELPANIEYCPTCGQILPADQFEEKREQLQETFNKNKVAKSNDLKARYQDAKKDIAEAEDTNNRYSNDISTTTIKIASLKKELEEAQQKKKEEEALLASLKAPEDTLPDNAEYVALQRECEQVKGQLTLTDYQGDDITKADTELCNKIASLGDDITSLQSVIASEAIYNKVLKNKEDIETERAGIANEITDLEGQLDIATEYSNLQGQVLEDKVNTRFKYVKWKMFKTYLNGAREDYCECYVDGIAYHDTLNTSAKTNAGLDIVSTLSEIYRAWCPIIVDNAEAVNKLIDTKSQQIRMYVSDEPLTIQS